MSREGLFVAVGMLRAGRPGIFFSVLQEARIYLCSQASTLIQAQTTSYSMEIGSFFPRDKAAGT